jgi:hypothetical protein
MGRSAAGLLMAFVVAKLNVMNGVGSGHSQLGGQARTTLGDE